MEIKISMFSFLESPLFDSYTDWLASIIISGAPLIPIVLLLLEEAGIPLPIPGDVYIAYVGYQASLGHISFITAFILLNSAVLLGSSILYFISFKWGRLLVTKIGIYLHINENRLEFVETKFRKYGVWVIIFGRHVPGMRVPITVFSGIAQVPYRKFILSTFISIIFWIPFYLYVGNKIGKNIITSLHANNWYFIIFLIPAILLIYSFIYFKIKKR